MYIVTYWGCSMKNINSLEKELVEIVNKDKHKWKLKN